MTSEQALWLAAARFDELMEFCRSERSDEFFADRDNARAYFARLHDVIHEECEEHAQAMLKWGSIPLDETAVGACVGYKGMLE